MSAALDLVGRTVSFCRELRARGVLATTAHALDAVRAVQSVPLGDRSLFYFALRTVLVARPEEFAIFDELFARTFALPGGETAERARNRRDEERPTPPRHLSVSRWLAQGEEPGGDEPEKSPGGSPEPALAEKDFASFTADQLEEIERVASRVARKLAARPGRRWKAARRGLRIDLRRTVRRSLGTGAEAIQLCFREKKPRKTRIVALCDVSGSMDLYSRFLLQFLYALQGTLARVESFVFATELSRVTEALRERPWARALRSLPGQASGWSGGTRIGECLSRFDEEWSDLLDRRTVLVILSDGWDTGEPEALSAALQSLRRRCRRVVWLNPLLGSPGYQPLAAGMQAALPHVGVFAPAHNLASLRALERHLLS